jgi:hypothetical protein
MNMSDEDGKVQILLLRAYPCLVSCRHVVLSWLVLSYPISSYLYGALRFGGTLFFMAHYVVNVWAYCLIAQGDYEQERERNIARNIAVVSTLILHHCDLD